jgi:hypothetical protein
MDNNIDHINKTKTAIDNELGKILGATNLAKLYDLLSTTNSYIAGGFVFNNFSRDLDSDLTYFGAPFHYNDIDIFTKSDDIANFIKQVGFKCYRDASADYFNFAIEHVNYFKKRNCIINVIGLDNNEVLDVIINNFDLDCCKMAYNGTDLYIHNINDLVEKRSLWNFVQP